MKTYLSYFIAGFVCSGALACGGSTGDKAADSGAPAVDAGALEDVNVEEAATHDAGVKEAAAEASGPVDHGAPSTTYPAFPPDVGQIANGGGYVMKNPVIVAITWPADPGQATFDTFADGIGATAFWKATTAEYGVGAAVSGTVNHVHMSTTPPATIQDMDLQNLVVANTTPLVDGGAAAWPAPTQDTIYAFFLAPSTSLLMQGMGGGTPQDACMQGVGGYHDQVTAGGVTTSYAVVPSCSNFSTTRTATQESTMSMSHELIEAVTDPHPQDMKPGYTGFDGDHFAWDYFQELQSETGDACEFYKASFFEDQETAPGPFDAWVQRTWSNASIKAAHDPCVPAPGPAPYFNVTPLQQAPVHFTIPGALTGGSDQVNPTKGILAPAGETVTFPVGFYSDGPTSGPWTVSVSPGNPILGSKSQIETYNTNKITASIDKTSGQNGEKAYVTVNVTTSGSLFAGEIVTIVSSLNGVSHYMPIWIAAN